MYFSQMKEVAAQIILFIWFSTSFSNLDIRLKEFVNQSEANYNLSPSSLHNDRSLCIDFSSQLAFILFVIQILLIIGGIEQNPGSSTVNEYGVISDIRT